MDGLIFHDNKKKEIDFLLQDKIFIISNIRRYNKIKVHFNSDDIFDSETDKLEHVIAKIQSKPIDNNI